MLKEYYVLKKIFSEDRIKWFIENRDQLILQKDQIKERVTIGDRKNQIFPVSEKSLLFQNIFDFISPLLPFDQKMYTVSSMSFYNLQNPYALHCDNLGEDKCFYQVIVPLEIKPKKPVYTIIFDQTSSSNTEWVAPIYDKPSGYKPFFNKPIFDPNWYGGWKDEYRITEEEGLKYWGETWETPFREAYKGFSIKVAYEWEIGDLFIFRSDLNHCASELKSFSIEQKSGFLIFMHKKEWS